jgi:hypothetical protein
MADREADPEVGHKGRTPGGQRLPTSAGGTTGIEPEEPGQSLGRVPERDDDDRDEAGDAHAAGPGTHDPHRD